MYLTITSLIRHQNLIVEISVLISVSRIYYLFISYFDTFRFSVPTVTGNALDGSVADATGHVYLDPSRWYTISLIYVRGDKKTYIVFKQSHGALKAITSSVMPAGILPVGTKVSLGQKYTDQLVGQTDMEISNLVVWDRPLVKAELLQL